jgi:hypothetical protein
MNLKELSHKGTNFKTDSVLAVDYEGYNDDRGFAPLNEVGNWISTISRIKKLSNKQIEMIQSVLGNPATFQKPIFAFCFEPRLGLIYFKDGKVIAQSAICLQCGRLESSAELGNGEYYTEFNKDALSELETLCLALGFSNCK